MIARIVTVITTEIDLDTMEPTHDIAVQATNGIPQNVVEAVVIGACKTVIYKIKKGDHTDDAAAE